MLDRQAQENMSRRMDAIGKALTRLCEALGKLGESLTEEEPGRRKRLVEDFNRHVREARRSVDDFERYHQSVSRIG